jgi:superfamily I DNA/RNA helicase
LRLPSHLSTKESNVLLAKLYKAFLRLKVELSFAYMTKSSGNVVDKMLPSNENWIDYLFPKLTDEYSQIGSMIKKIDFRSLYLSYIRRLKELNYLHYEDMLPYGLSLIKPSYAKDIGLQLATSIAPEQSIVLSAIHAKYQYIFCDEFQDTNRLQLELLFSITSHARITVVGDINQCIYGFQGAEYQNLNRFIQNYRPHVNIIRLRVNYRSHEDIITAAGRVIPGPMISLQRYLEQHQQSSSCARSNQLVCVPRHRVFLTQCLDLQAQYAYIVNAINLMMHPANNLNPQIRSKPLQLRDVAILYRKNEFGAAFKNYLDTLPPTHGSGVQLSSKSFHLSKAPVNMLAYADQNVNEAEDEMVMNPMTMQPGQRVLACLELILALYRYQKSHEHENQENRYPGRMTMTIMEEAGADHEVFSELQVMSALPTSLSTNEQTIDAVNRTRKYLESLSLPDPSSSSSPSISINESFFFLLHQVIFKGAAPTLQSSSAITSHPVAGAGDKKRKRSSEGAADTSMIAGDYAINARGLQNWMKNLLEVHQMIVHNIRDLAGIITKIIEITLPERKQLITSSSRSHLLAQPLSREGAGGGEDQLIQRIMQASKTYHLYQSQGVSLYDELRSFAHEIYDLIRQQQQQQEEAEEDHHDSSASSSRENQVWLGTIHRAKGREWEVVFVVNANDHEFQSSSARSINQNDDDCHHEDDGDGKGHVSEEQRLLYVALSRAKDELHISYLGNSSGSSSSSSPSAYEAFLAVTGLAASSDSQEMKLSRYLKDLCTLPSQSLRRLCYPPPGPMSKPAAVAAGKQPQPQAAPMKAGFQSAKLFHHQHQSSSISNLS